LPPVIFWADTFVVLAVTAILNVATIAIAVKNNFVFMVCLLFDTIYSSVLSVIDKSIEDAGYNDMNKAKRLLEGVQGKITPLMNTEKK
jgi:hypothetical protein